MRRPPGDHPPTSQRRVFDLGRGAPARPLSGRPRLSARSPNGGAARGSCRRRGRQVRAHRALEHAKRACPTAPTGITVKSGQITCQTEADRSLANNRAARARTAWIKRAQSTGTVDLKMYAHDVRLRRSDLIREVLNWYDKYLARVNSRAYSAPLSAPPPLRQRQISAIARNYCLPPAQPSPQVLRSGQRGEQSLPDHCRGQKASGFRLGHSAHNSFTVRLIGRKRNDGSSARKTGRLVA